MIMNKSNNIRDIIIKIKDNIMNKSCNIRDIIIKIKR